MRYYNTIRQLEDIRRDSPCLKMFGICVAELYYIEHIPMVPAGYLGATDGRIKIFVYRAGGIKLLVYQEDNGSDGVFLLQGP